MGINTDEGRMQERRMNGDGKRGRRRKGKRDRSKERQRETYERREEEANDVKGKRDG
jgi:hypothetical protein